VDVGHGQLDWKLRSDDRVVCMEKTNFRYMVRDDIQDDLDFASCDVSFISLTKILLPARRLLKDGGEMVCLIKPQFEAGKEKVGKKGVVRDPKVHEEVVHRIIDFTAIAGFEVLHLDFSPIKGPEGNIEYLVHIRKNPEMNEQVAELTEADGEKKLRDIETEKSGFSHSKEMEELISKTVAAAHGNLDV
jgi:23S rRNA (cytidine1920-2'-O)/16S rRNA (cytidine1409-2'-O)-methyltransferase